jgi:hypothetical protein
VIAALTTIWALSQPALPTRLGHKTAGALLGATLSIVLDIIVAGSGNTFTVFLVTLMAILAGLACCTLRWNAQAACFTQCCAMFTVAAPMIPAPDTSLAAMGSRIVAILIGFGSAAGVYGLMRLAPPHVSDKVKV